MQVKSRQQRVVVQHFFKVRNQPFRVRRIAMKAAAWLIVDTSVRHFPTSLLSHLKDFRATCAVIGTQEKLERHRRGKLWRPAEAAIYSVRGARNSDGRFM